jgi:leucyl-tRNA synthetase
MLAPVAPHACEELWEMMGGEGFVSLSSWPIPDESKVDIRAEENEALITSVVEDTLNITKATGATPKKIFYYVAARWKWQTWLKALEKSMSAKIAQKDLMKELMANAEMRAKAEKVSKFTAQITDDLNRMAEERKKRLAQINLVDEAQALREAKDFFEKELNAEVNIYDEEDAERYDPRSRAQVAKPGRPAIFIE